MMLVLDVSMLTTDHYLDVFLSHKLKLVNICIIIYYELQEYRFELEWYQKIVFNTITILMCGWIQNFQKSLKSLKKKFKQKNFLNDCL